MPRRGQKGESVEELRSQGGGLSSEQVALK